MSLAAAVVALAAAGCSSSTPTTGMLSVSVSGDGQVAATRASPLASCSGCGAGAGDGGTTVLGYLSGTEITLDAQPAAGWSFGYWQITVSTGGEGPSTLTSSAPVVTIYDTGDHMDVVAVFSN